MHNKVYHLPHSTRYKPIQEQEGLHRDAQKQSLKAYSHAISVTVEYLRLGKSKTIMVKHGRFRRSNNFPMALKQQTCIMNAQM